MRRLLRCWRWAKDNSPFVCFLIVAGTILGLTIAHLVQRSSP